MTHTHAPDCGFHLHMSLDECTCPFTLDQAVRQAYREDPNVIPRLLSDYDHAPELTCAIGDTPLRFPRAPQTQPWSAFIQRVRDLCR